MKAGENKMIETLKNILTADDVVASVRENLDILLEIIPEIKPMIGFDHKHPHHHLDVFEHTLLALSLSENIFIVRLALLLHDIGKPFSYTEGDVRHFHGHPEVSADISRDVFLRIGFEKNFVDTVCYLIKGHDTNITESDIVQNYNLSYLRFLVQKCDALAHNPEKLEKRKMYLKRTKELFCDKL